MLLYIDAPHFYAGLMLSDYKVFHAAPILMYMMGWDLLRVAEYCSKKGWNLCSTCGETM